jgi:hypothetical protein
MRKSSAELLKDATKFPIHECLVAEDAWRKLGIAMSLVTRQIVPGRFMYAVYFVDTYCLGLKDTFAAANVSLEEYIEARARAEQRFKLVPLDYEGSRSLVLGAIDYSRTLGFEPNDDWRESSHVIEADRSYNTKFEFGKEGKPCYVQGLNDNPGEVIRTLTNGNHDYSVVAATQL